MIITFALQIPWKMNFNSILDIVLPILLTEIAL